MEILGRRFRIVPLDALLSQLMSGALQPRQACVTFDDGYADNYEHAFPVLRRLGIPATIFLATSYVERSTPFWWDRLTWYVNKTAGSVLWLPRELGGTAIDLTSRERVEQALFDLWQQLQRLGDAHMRERILDALGADAPFHARPLTWQEAMEMQRHGIVIGAHTHSHPSLVALSDAALWQEITTSRDLVALRLGTSPSLFAYTFGDADTRVTRAVGEAGFVGAVTTHPDLCSLASSRYLLPRLVVGNWNGQLFQRRIDALSQARNVEENGHHHLKRILTSVLALPVVAAAKRIGTRLVRHD